MVRSKSLATLWCILRVSIHSRASSSSSSGSSGGDDDDDEERKMMQMMVASAGLKHTACYDVHGVAAGATPVSGCGIASGASCSSTHDLPVLGLRM